MKTLIYTFALCLFTTLVQAQDPDYDPYYEEETTTTNENKGRDTRALADSMRMIQETVQNMSMRETDVLTEARMKRKLIPALEGFLNTEFMLKFYDLKKESEGLVAAFKAEQMEYHPRDVQEVKTAYEQVRTRFNGKLMAIKNDFKDKKKQKIIRDAPDMYSSGLGYEMQQLKDFYDAVFRQTLADVRGNDLDGAIPVTLILSMIELVGEVTNYMITSNYNTRRMTEAYLQENFITPYSLMAWDEIQMSEGDIYKSSNETELFPAVNGEFNDPFYEDNSGKSDTTSNGLRLKKNN